MFRLVVKKTEMSNFLLFYPTHASVFLHWKEKHNTLQLNIYQNSTDKVYFFHHGLHRLSISI